MTIDPIITVYIVMFIVNVAVFSEIIDLNRSVQKLRKDHDTELMRIEGMVRHQAHLVYKHYIEEHK